MPIKGHIEYENQACSADPRPFPDDRSSLDFGTDDCAQVQMGSVPTFGPAQGFTRTVVLWCRSASAVAMGTFIHRKPIMSSSISRSNAAAPSLHALRLAQSPLHMLLRAAVAGLLFAASGLVQAAFVPFTARVDGVSQILEVIDPNGPLVRVQTLAFVSGSPGSLTYRSGDIINLGNGQGSGTNRFTTADGDELFGSFTVQLVPGADASLFDLIGHMLFTGGTRDFLRASGSATFTAHGQFVSAFEATTQFEFEGLVATVPAPGTAALGLMGLLSLAFSRLRKSGNSVSATCRRRWRAAFHRDA